MAPLTSIGAGPLAWASVSSCFSAGVPACAGPACAGFGYLRRLCAGGRPELERRGYAPGDDGPVTKCLSNTFRVSGCTVFGWTRQEVIAEDALFLLLDLVGFENVLPGLRARHDERDGRRVALYQRGEKR